MCGLSLRPLTGLIRIGRMDKNTKIAVVILGAAIVISVIGPLAIAFAVGYLSATVVNSPSFDQSRIVGQVNKWMSSLGWKKLE